jgi:hypothetical protein
MRGNPAKDGELRRREPLAHMAAADPTLEAVYRYWAANREDGPMGGLLPRRRRIDAGRLAPAAGQVELLHITGRYPDLRFRLHGSLVWLDRLRIADEDLAAVAWLGSPLYQTVVRRRAPAAPCYGRLVLPLTEDGRRVSLLAVCTTARASDALSA